MIKAAALHGASVWLVPFGPGHLTDRYVAWLNDPLVVRYSEQRHRHHTLESCRIYVDSFEGTDHRLWAIEAEGGRHVGNMSAIVDAPNGVADLAILVGDRSVWGTGVGSDAWRTALAWLLGPAGLRKITAGTMSENAGMLALFRKSDMIMEGRRCAQFLLEGRPVDLVLAARFRG